MVMGGMATWPCAVVTHDLKYDNGKIMKDLEFNSSTITKRS